MASESKRSEIPHELRGNISAFDSALNNVESEFEPLLKMSQVELNTELIPLDKAKLDLVAAYSINSLFWMYLNVCGVNPKDHGIKQELDRIRSYMNRVKEIQDKEKAPKLDVKASKRFVKSALWQAAQEQNKQEETQGKESSKQSEDLVEGDLKHKRSSKRKGDHKTDFVMNKQKNRYMHKVAKLNLK